MKVSRSENRLTFLFYGYPQNVRVKPGMTEALGCARDAYCSFGRRTVKQAPLRTKDLW